jgi:NAD(P)-dependent dehydrogenase (short-subunit alcohol dehydrogenase family)
MQDFVARPEHGIAWISGASSGIGRALALKLAGEGYKVAVTARDHEKLAELQAEANGLSGSIIVLDGDVTNAEDMEHVLASIEYEHGALALAIFNAGVYLPVHAEELKREDFEQSFAVNLQGVVNCLVPAVSHMKAKGQGQIAIVSSVTGYGGLPTGAAYGATKAALINMAESLKFDLDKMGIRIQLINPGLRRYARHPQERLPDAVAGVGRGGSGSDIRRPEVAELRDHFPQALHLRDEASQLDALRPLLLVPQPRDGLARASALPASPTGDSASRRVAASGLLTRQMTAATGGRLPDAIHSRQLREKTT